MQLFLCKKESEFWYAIVLIQLWYSKPQKVAKLCRLDRSDHILHQETEVKMKTALQQPFPPSDRTRREWLRGKAFAVPLSKFSALWNSWCCIP